MDKQSFVMYTSYKEQFSLLSDSDKGILIMALFEYTESGIPPKLEGMPLMAFSFIKMQLDRDNKKYEKTVEARKEAGKLGGRPKKQTKAKKANGFSEKQTKAKKPVYEDVYEYVYDNEDEKNKRHLSESAGANIGRAELFLQFWNAYPKKMGKGNCEKWFTSHKPSKELVVTMLTAIEKQIKSENWTKEGGRYIPMPYTWLNGKRWEDKLATSQENQGTAGYDIGELEEMNKFNPVEDV